MVAIVQCGCGFQDFWKHRDTRVRVGRLSAIREDPGILSSKLTYLEFLLGRTEVGPRSWQLLQSVYAVAQS